MVRTQRRVLHWENLFPRPGGVPIVARHNVRHPDCRAHSHDFMELVLIAGGAGRHCSPAGECSLSRGDVIVLRPGGWHAYTACRALEIYNVAFGAEVLHQEVAWSLQDPLLSHVLVSGPLSEARRGVLNLRLHDASLSRCETHAQELCDLDERPDGAAQHAQRVGLLLMILGDIVDGVDLDAADVGNGRGLHRAVMRGMMLFERDLSRTWALQELAERVGLEKSYLVRQFKAGTGMPPMTYLSRRRAERAAHLLIRTDEPVARIARRVGWTDPVYFARRFKAHFGMTATEYRERFTTAEDVTLP